MVSTRSLVAPVSILIALATFAAACGSDDDSGDDTAATAAGSAADNAEAPENTVAGDDGAATDPETGDEAVEADPPPADPAFPADGRYRVGDTYTDGEFSAVYLGLIEIPLGPDIWPDGACYAVAWDATFLDPLEFGSDEFQPAVDAYLLDGRVADDDQTGVGCDQKVLPPAGYERGIETTIAAGETVRIYSGPFRVAAADIGSVDIVALFGSGPETGLDPEITATLTAG